MGNPEPEESMLQMTTSPLSHADDRGRGEVNSHRPKDDVGVLSSKSYSTSSELSDKDQIENDWCTTLNLNSKDLSVFPRSALRGDISKICELCIEYNNLTEIPSGLSKHLPNLRSFLADGNQLTTLPADFGEFAFLEKLSVCENNLVSLPESLFQLKKIQILKVSSNSLKQLHSEIGQNGALEEIYVDENKLKRLPATLGLLKNLKSLIANDNKITQLISTLGKCESLEIVDLSRNCLRQLPESFGDLKHLISLDLSENQISCLGNHFSSHKSLQKLYLDLNNLACFPDWFSDLEKIQEITMINNDLAGSAVPEGFGFKSQELRLLDLRGNFMEQLPDSIGSLASLQECLLGTPLGYLERSPNFQNGNWLRSLPDSVCNLTALTRLCVEENQLLALPDEIGNLVNLRDLYLGSNMLDVLPKSFTKLSSMKRCQLSKNRLKKLPEDIGTLSQLVELYLDSNMLRNLPPSMKCLVNLEIFDLTENKLKVVPKDILDSMTNLKALNMFFNKFEVPHSEIPYIIKRTHYAEKNPEFKGNWRGRNNARINQQESNVNNCHEETSPASDVESDSEEPNETGTSVVSSVDEDWDAHIPPSSSGSSDLAPYMQSANIGDDDEEEEDWDKETKPNSSRLLSSDIEEGQFDLDEDEMSSLPRPILPSPVRFDTFGNSSRPIDFGVQYHRQTPYVYHAPSVSRHLYSPGPWMQGQFDDADGTCGSEDDI